MELISNQSFYNESIISFLPRYSPEFYFQLISRFKFFVQMSTKNVFSNCKVLSSSSKFHHYAKRALTLFENWFPFSEGFTIDSRKRSLIESTAIMKVYPGYQFVVSSEPSNQQQSPNDLAYPSNFWMAWTISPNLMKPRDRHISWQTVNRRSWIISAGYFIADCWSCPGTCRGLHPRAIFRRSIPRRTCIEGTFYDVTLVHERYLEFLFPIDIVKFTCDLR